MSDNVIQLRINCINFLFTVVQDYLYEFSQSYLPSDGAIARIISVISNPGNAISGNYLNLFDPKIIVNKITTL